MTQAARQIMDSFDLLPESDQRTVASEILRRSIQLIQVPASPAKAAEPAPRESRYSFIGIARSGRSDLSKSVQESLAESADRREGWRLPD